MERRARRRQEWARSSPPVLSSVRTSYSIATATVTTLRPSSHAATDTQHATRNTQHATSARRPTTQHTALVALFVCTQHMYTLTLTPISFSFCVIWTHSHRLATGRIVKGERSKCLVGMFGLETDGQHDRDGASTLASTQPHKGSLLQWTSTTVHHYGLVHVPPRPTSSTLRRSFELDSASLMQTGHFEFASVAPVCARHQSHCYKVSIAVASKTMTVLELMKALVDTA
jgi:hypothetical protein